MEHGDDLQGTGEAFIDLTVPVSGRVVEKSDT